MAVAYDRPASSVSANFARTTRCVFRAEVIDGSRQGLTPLGTAIEQVEIRDVGELIYRCTIKVLFNAPGRSSARRESVSDSAARIGGAPIQVKLLPSTAEDQKRSSW